MYADTITDSMKNAIEETKRRRQIQAKYNEEHGITPTTIKKAVRDVITINRKLEEAKNTLTKDPESMDIKEIKKLIETTEKQMRKATAELDFETAAELRDQIKELRKYLEQ